MKKSATDIHWNERAVKETDISAVNIADVSQRELETGFLLQHLRKTDKVLEVGCGNGFLTNILRDHVASVDAFDYAENMVDQARQIYHEKNNRFFHDNVLEPTGWQGPYDCIVCVRVLINLRNLEEQKLAIENMRKALKPGGRLLLIEGYLEGFEEINRIRTDAGMPPLSPASINFYSRLQDIIKESLEPGFDIKATFHTGCFDFLTRIVYPAVVGAENATGYSEFHGKMVSVARAYNQDQFRHLARLHGFELVKKA